MGFTQEEIDDIKSRVETFMIPKGTKLFRTQPVNCSDRLVNRYDPDTGKQGLYFSNGPIIPLGMILEYNKPLNLCIYELTDDVIVLGGKYSFRYLDPTHYFRNYKDALDGNIISK